MIFDTAGQDAINEMHPEEVKARFSNAVSFFKQMDHTQPKDNSNDSNTQSNGTNGTNGTRNRKASSEATRTLWRAAASIIVTGKYFERRRASIAYMESTVVDISFHLPSFKPVSFSKTPKQVFFNPINIFCHLYHTLLSVL